MILCITIHTPSSNPFLQAFVGNKGSEHYHVFELTRQLPRFAMYCRLLEPSGNAPPRSHVHFRLNERAARVALWLNQAWR